MKTTIQQIIEKFEHIQENDCKTLTEVIFLSGVLAILESEYLAVEKQQIMDAYELGEKNIDFPALHGQGKLSNATKYYTSTFNTTNKETLK